MSDLIAHGKMVNTIINRMADFGYDTSRALEFANVVATEIGLVLEKKQPSSVSEYHAIIEDLHTLQGEVRVRADGEPSLVGRTLDLIERLATLVGGHRHNYVRNEWVSPQQTTPPVG